MGASRNELAAFVIIKDDAVRSAPAFLKSADNPSPQRVGEWLSLVEHLVRDQGVAGSNPVSPTNLTAGLVSVFPSGSGLLISRLRQFGPRVDQTAAESVLLTRTVAL